MLRAPFRKLVALGLLQIHFGFVRVCAVPLQDDGCAVRSPSEPVSFAVVIDSIEFQADAALTSEDRTRLAEDFKQGHLEASSGMDMEWRHELANQVQSLLQDRGYFRASVEVTAGLVRAEAHRTHYWVSVQAESGPQYRLGAVKFGNATEFSQSKLRTQLELQEGDLFSVGKVREGVVNLTRLYGKLGYIDLTVEPQTYIDDDERRIDLTLILEVGTQYRVRSVTIRGFDGPIESRLRSRFESGQVFDRGAAHEFFSENRGVLPKDTSDENSVHIIRDSQHGEVDLIFEPRTCGPQ